MSDQLARHVETVEADETQRTTLYELIAQDPYRGQLKACRDAGIAGTGGQLRDWFKQDPAVQEHLADARNEYLKGKRLDIDTLLDKVSAIVHNDESQSQWRAVDWAFGTLHQMGSKQAVQVEHTGPDGGPVKVNTQHGVSLTDVAALLVRVGALPAGVGSDVDRKALPAAPSLLAEPLPEA